MRVDKRGGEEELRLKNEGELEEWRVFFSCVCLDIFVIQLI
jgi:hypothetical protein